MVVELVDHAQPPPGPPCLARHLVRDRVERAGDEVAKDSHARKRDRDRQQLRARTTGRRVETGERRGDRRAVERLVPRLVQERRKPETAAREDDDDRPEGDRNAAKIGAIHRSSIVGGRWKTTSAS